MVLEEASSPAMTSASPKLHSNILNRYEVTSDVMPACVATSFPHGDVYKPRLGRDDQLSESSSPEVASYDCYAPAYRTFEPGSPSTDSGAKSDESRKSDLAASPAKRSPDSNRNNNSCKAEVNERLPRPDECPASTPNYPARNPHPLKKRMLFGRSGSSSPVEQQRKSPQGEVTAPSRQFPGSSDILRQMYAAFGGEVGRRFINSPDQTRTSVPAAGREAPSEGPLPPGARSPQGQASPLSSPDFPERRPEARVACASRSSVPHATENRAEDGRRAIEQSRKRRTESGSLVNSPSKVNKLSSLQSDKKTAFHAYKRKPSSSGMEQEQRNNSRDSESHRRKRKSNEASSKSHSEIPSERTDSGRRRSLSGVKRSRHTSSESCDSSGANQGRAPYAHSAAAFPTLPYASPFAFNPAAFGLPGMGVHFGIPPVPQPAPAAVNPFLLGANSYLTNPLLLREMLAAQTNAATMTSLFPNPAPLGGFPSLMPGITLEQIQALQHLQASALGQGNPPHLPMPGKHLDLESRRLSKESRRNESRERVRSPVTPPHLPRDQGLGKVPRTPLGADHVRVAPFLNKGAAQSGTKSGGLPKPRSERKRSEKREKTKNKGVEPRKPKNHEPIVPPQKKTNVEKTPPPVTQLEDIDEPRSGESSPCDGTSGCQKSAGYKNLTRERRLVANARERTRVHTISSAFDELRAQVPSYSCNQKLSKLAILRIACSYIRTLSVLAGRDETTPFSHGVDQCTRVLQAESRARSRRKSNKAQIEWEMVNYERQKSVEEGTKPPHDAANYASDDATHDDVTRDNVTEVDVETVDERIDVLEDVTNRTNGSDEGGDRFAKATVASTEEKTHEVVNLTPPEAAEV